MAELIEQRSRLDAGEAAWLAELARFDASGEWAVDGQLSATGWLVVDLHHLRWWEHGGCTDVDNGLLFCTRHHTLVHEGVFVIAGHPNDALIFLLPSGEVIGVTRPRIGALLQPDLVPTS